MTRSLISFPEGSMTFPDEDLPHRRRVLVVEQLAPDTQTAAVLDSTGDVMSPFMVGVC